MNKFKNTQIITGIIKYEESREFFVDLPDGLIKELDWLVGDDLDIDVIKSGKILITNESWKKRNNK